MAPATQAVRSEMNIDSGLPLGCVRFSEVCQSINIGTKENRGCGKPLGVMVSPAPHYPERTCVTAIAMSCCKNSHHSHTKLTSSTVSVKIFMGAFKNNIMIVIAVETPVANKAAYSLFHSVNFPAPTFWPEYVVIVIPKVKLGI